MQVSSFMRPYFEAGHDIESLFSAPSYKCERCGIHQIDLSEDLVYGEMSRCLTAAPSTKAEPQ